MTKGKYIRTKEIREKTSKTLKKLWQNPEYRKKNKGSTGYKHTKEAKEKSRKSNKQYYKEHPEAREKDSINVKQNWKDGKMNGVFQSPTYPEKRIMKILNNLKTYFIFQFRPDGYSKIYDFYIPKWNLLIEYDGWYWHNLSGAKERDAEKTEYAKKHSYNLLRINKYNINILEIIFKKLREE